MNAVGWSPDYFETAVAVRHDTANSTTMRALGASLRNVQHQTRQDRIQNVARDHTCEHGRDMIPSYDHAHVLPSNNLTRSAVGATMSMLKVISREYKVVLNHQLFETQEQPIPAFWREVRRCAKRLGVETKGSLDTTERRRIVFLDTLDQTIYLNRLVLRRRAGKHCVEYTLKCRSPDRYFSTGSKLEAAKRLKAKEKLEEDISAPFLSRFSHSVTAQCAGKSPRSLGEAAAIFPLLGKLKRDGRACHPKTKLTPVNSLEAFEQVHTGPRLRIAGTSAEVAIILWSSTRKGRLLVGEFSFRYASKKERYSSAVSELAMEFFHDIQQLDWCRPSGVTKTQYVYRSK